MFSKIQSLSLFSYMRTHALKHKVSSRVLFITDSEGSQSPFISAIKNSQTVKYNHDNGLSFHKTKEIPYFIFGGDATDRGNGDLSLVQMLLDFKRRHPEQVFLIVGNRDITKNRFKIELDEGLIRTRLLNSQSPRWLTQQTVPLDYVKKEMETENFSDSVADYVNILSIEKCQLIYLKWMLEKTMGCPHSFRYRKEELQRIYPNTVISDIMVLRSFINESSPKGIHGQYLQQAQVGVIIPNTGLLAVHGGLLPDNIGRIPGMATNDHPIEETAVWIDQFNKWYAKQIQKWIDYHATELTVPAFTELDECVLPLPHKTKSIITADMLNSDRQFMRIPNTVANSLRENGISVVLTGHQPCGDHPAIIRDKGLLFINGDTGYAAFNPQIIDDTRGEATHTLEFIADENKEEIDLHAILPNKTKVRTKLSINGDTIEGDPYIGFVTSEHELVQCRLADGNYRLAAQQGFNVKYSTRAASEVSQLIDSEEQIINNRRIS